MIDRRRVGRIAARWATELVVVFVGVYGAFALAEWEEDRERDRRAAQIRGALVEEIRGIQSNTRGAWRQFALGLEQMDAAMRAGQTPRLTPIMEAIGFRTHVWQATLAAGELGLLDVETFYEVSEFYNALNAGFEQLEQLRELSQTMLLPILDDPASIPYTGPDSTGAVRLRPQYRWYLDGLQRTGRIARCVTVQGDSVLQRLGATPDTTGEPISSDGC